jgi:hypothetical protein
VTSFRVKLWDTSGTHRGRGNLKAVIDDAKDIGGSAYANDAGEFFMTLPINHPQIDTIAPWQTHYEVSRRNSSGTYDPLFVGLINNYVQDENEAVVYGVDYLGLYDLSISGSNTSYTSKAVSFIVQDQMSLAMNGTGANPNSPTEFITMGTIQTTSKTTTVLTSFEPRLSFARKMLGILSAGNSTLPLLSVTRSAPIALSFASNAGADKTNVRLEYGGNVNNFRYDPGFDQLSNDIHAIGQKRDGAAILYSISSVSLAPSSTYGLIQAGRLFIDLVDQQALDDLTNDAALRLSNQQRVAIGISSGKVVPWDGWDLMDSLKLVIKRGLVDVDDLYTVWGVEWIGHRDGHEDLLMDLQPKLT